MVNNIMKKKVWEVWLLDAEKNAKNTHNSNFVTIDTNANLVIKIMDEGLNVSAGIISLYNHNDGSYVDEVVDVQDNVLTFKMRKEIIEHAGNWIFRGTFEHDNQYYASDTINFTVHGHFGDEKLPKLEIVGQIENLEERLLGLLEGVDEADFSIAEINTKFNDIFVDQSTQRLLNPDNTTEGSYINDEGEIIESQNFSHTEYIPVVLGDTLRFVSGQYSTVRYYDKNKKRLETVTFNQEVIKEITNPEVAYFVLAFWTSESESVVVERLSGLNRLETNPEKLTLSANDPTLNKQLQDLKKELMENAETKGSNSTANSNSEEILRIPTPYDDGSEWYGRGNQTTHPSVVQFEEEWNGYKYWMAHTPYPFMRASAENPCIAASNDGVAWQTPAGANNPLVNTPAEGYNSDTHMLFNSDTQQLEIWYREVSGGDTVETLYRITSADGVTWSDPQAMKTATSTPNNVLKLISPSVVYEEGIYRLWVMEDWHIKLHESVDGIVWEEKGWIKSEDNRVHTWHPSIQKINGLYHMVNCDKRSPQGARGVVKYSTSEDGMNWTKEIDVVNYTGNPWDFDGTGVYRPSLAIIDGVYYLYYGMVSHDFKYTIGLTTGRSMTSLKGIDHRVLEFYNVN